RPGPGRRAGRRLRALRPSGGDRVIVTLTLNPSLDRTVEIDELVRGAVLRATSARLDPGGKGVNVCRALLANGVPSRAVVAVGGGSLPPGVPEDLYAQLVHAARAAGVKVAVDTSGPPLLAALRAGPDLVKPNREELAEAVGFPVDTVADAVKAAGLLRV